MGSSDWLGNKDVIQVPIPGYQHETDPGLNCRLNHQHFARVSVTVKFQRVPGIQHRTQQGHPTLGAFRTVLKNRAS
jgi:hypothetical protein